MGGGSFSAEHRRSFGVNFRRRRHFRSENGHVRLGFRRNFRRVAAIFQWRTGNLFDDAPAIFSETPRRSFQWRTGNLSMTHRRSFRWRIGDLSVAHRRFFGLFPPEHGFAEFSACHGDLSAEHRQSFGGTPAIFRRDTDNLSAEHRRVFRRRTGESAFGRIRTKGDFLHGLLAVFLS